MAKTSLTATSKNITPVGIATKLKTSTKVVRGLAPAVIMKATEQVAKNAKDQKNSSVARSKLVSVIKRFSGSSGTGVATLRFATKSKFPTTAHIPPQHDTLVKLVSPGKVWVHCGCEDFVYRWEYALAQQGASSIINGNGEPAVTRNPANIPGACLHVYKVLGLMSTMKRLTEVQKSVDAKASK